MKLRSFVKWFIILIFLVGLVFHLSIEGYQFKIKEKAFDYLNATDCNKNRVKSVKVNFNYDNIWKLTNPWEIKVNVYGRYELFFKYKDDSLVVDKKTNEELINKLNSKTLCNKEEDLFGEISNFEFEPSILSMTLADFNKSKIKIIIYNRASNNYTYDESYTLEYFNNDIWYQVIPIKELVFDMNVYQVPSLASADIEIDTSINYGTLLPGRYRIVKEFSLKSNHEKKIYAEAKFEIN